LHRDVNQITSVSLAIVFGPTLVTGMRRSKTMSRYLTNNRLFRVITDFILEGTPQKFEAE
jgi:hypothetical protein